VENGEETFLRQRLRPVSPRALTAQGVTRFRRTVYAYYRRYGRTLPWRTTRDPYRILLSEIMLQQTQVSRVVEKYEAFLAAFPDFPSLARARLKDVLAVWKGMGYNRRAMALKATAERVVAGHGGELPGEAEALVRLPGVGPATAAAVCAYAFGRPVVFVETNVRAVFIHVFFGRRRAVTDAAIRPLVERTLDRRDPHQWYSALMDLGVAIKRAFGNPARRSAHHVRQGPFEGSRRQVRGRILGALIEAPARSPAEIARRAGLPAERVAGPLGDLIAEGLVVKHKRRYAIP
jgi:A/G-specific adenine glycosylase